MKETIKVYLSVLMVLVLTGCVQSNEEKTIEWVKDHQIHKPIVVTLYGKTELGYSIYTLVDSVGCMYATGRVAMALPDTLNY